MPKQTEIDRIYSHFEEECQRYFNRIYPGMRQVLYNGWGKFKDELNSLYDLYIFQNYLLDLQEEYFKRNATVCISTFYSKTASDILCLYQCLRQGQIISSMSIERNIFESYVNLKLILKEDTQARIKLYEDFATVQRWNRIEEYKNYIKKLADLGNMTQEEIDKEKDYLDNIVSKDEIEVINDEYEKIKENYLQGRPFHWAWKIFKDESPKGRNPSLSLICDKLGISSMYMQVYSLNSIVVHSQSLMTGMLIQNGGITPSANFNNNLKAIAASSSSLATEIILLVLEYAQSPKYEEVRLYLNEKWVRTF